MKILICNVSYDGLMSQELMWFLIESGRSSYQTIPYPSAHRPTGISRNQAVAQARVIGAHLIFIDADCVPPRGAFCAIADKITSEVCVAALPYCASNGSIVVGEYDYKLKDVEGKTGWHSVRNCGTHCVGYNISCFENIKSPYYEYEYNQDKTSMLCSEDWICHRKMREAALPIFVNFSYWCGHLVTKNVEIGRSLTDFEKQLVMETL
jgi:hypothetical protein